MLDLSHFRMISSLIAHRQGSWAPNLKFKAHLHVQVTGGAVPFQENRLVGIFYVERGGIRFCVYGVGFDVKSLTCADAPYSDLAAIGN